MRFEESSTDVLINRRSDVCKNLSQSGLEIFSGRGGQDCRIEDLFHIC